MNTFDVQSIEIAAPFSTAFRYIADPANLPEWTHAFKQVEDGRATMETPAGAVQVQLGVEASETHGTVDWRSPSLMEVSQRPPRAWFHTLITAFTSSCSRRLRYRSSGSKVR